MEVRVHCGEGTCGGEGTFFSSRSKTPAACAREKGPSISESAWQGAGAAVGPKGFERFEGWCCEPQRLQRVMR